MKALKLIGLILAYLLGIGCLVASYQLDVFTVAKLGMNRWVVYNTPIWLEQYHLDTIDKGLGILMVILLAVGIVLWIRGRQKRRFYVPLTLLGTACAEWFVTKFMFGADVADYHAYYLQVLFGTMGCIILALIGICSGRKKEKNV